MDALTDYPSPDVWPLLVLAILSPSHFCLRTERQQQYYLNVM